jgi:uncharacterized protein with von Willebrand factor type A (vWA) domain
MEKDEYEDNVYGDVLKGFENLEDLLTYCKEQKIELEIHYEDEYDTNVTVVFGYDYIIATFEELVSQTRQLKGKSFYTHKYTY